MRTIAASTSGNVSVAGLLAVRVALCFMMTTVAAVTINVGAAATSLLSYLVWHSEYVY